MKVKHLIGIITAVLIITGAVFFLVCRQSSENGQEGAPRFLYAIGGVTEKERLKEPSFAIAGNNKLFVSSSGSGEIKVFDVKGKFRYTFNEAGKGNKLKYPLGIAVLDNERLLVSDSQKGALYEFTARGKFIREWAAAKGELLPGFMAVGPDSNVYVSDLTGKQIVVFNQKGSIIKKLKPQGVTLDSPQGIAFTDKQTIVVGDNANYNVKILGPDGQLKFLFDGGPRLALTTVKGIAADSRGRIYVAETMANVIRVFDSRGQELTSFGGKGSSPGQFMFPTGMSIDDKNRIYIADKANDRIQVWGY